MAELIPAAVPLPFHFIGRGNSMYTPHMGEMTFGMDLLGVLQLELTWIREVTDELNPREEPSLEPNEPRHVLNTRTMK